MFNPEQKDFDAIKKWGLDESPLRAINDFEDSQLDKRWDNTYHNKAHEAYLGRRAQWIANENFDNYYKKAEKPIDRKRWEYLKDRKAWYILPLKWEKFAEASVSRILDLGCGDGDVTQRMIDFIITQWEERGYEGHALEVVGLDLNPSRIMNAKEHVRANHPKISVSFDVCDAIGGGIPYEDQYFDYSATSGVLEILEDEPAAKYSQELARVTKNGIYIEDLYDEYPGGYPRDDLESLFKPDFTLLERHIILTEPFVEEGTLDPMELWPVLKDQVLFLERK